ncbi:hypothetical protein Cch01nite_02610 [Cellulomonas chitinilytica]|uniref:Uncharacterized protein n=1 Tax=Cellulomonas chitinilytica TaxID=398759 RepID=A0A919U0H1_9CELL|nr:hypothetical protein [Cellulomonas chitinilytica]GIG19537.1 hypothetical protein Cch01nite_02610 [Cellulomonas chitinilytica]
MRPHRRSTAAALLLSASLVLATAACTGGGDDADDAPPSSPTAAGTTVEWPTAIDPATTTDAFWVVWTDVVENGDGATQKVQPTIEKLGEVGYDTLPWDPSCQSGAEEQLAGLTGYADPLGVGVAFATAEDAGKFDTLFEGTISVTQGTYTCATSS